MSGIVDNISSQMHSKFWGAGAALFSVLTLGSIGYWVIGNGKYSVVDCFYMTVITITTIGYGEIIDLSGNSVGRIFTILIALFGIGTLTYILSNFTAFIIEGELNETLRRKKMEKLVKKLKEHYIICGIEGVGFHIVNELVKTNRPHIIVDIDIELIGKALEFYHEKVYIQGDPTDNDILIKAGILKAKGLFAVSGEDNQNLVIVITAKQLNPNIRVVARCLDPKNIEKMKKAGADAVVSTTYIGGLRMASEMVRPTVVSFLDIMLRDKEKNLRIEEIRVTDFFSGMTISGLNLKKYKNMLLMAVKKEDNWVFNPPEDFELNTDHTLVFMCSSQERVDIEEFLRGNNGN
jgi:voltage-gated potassium channel